MVVVRGGNYILGRKSICEDSVKLPVNYSATRLLKDRLG